MDGLEHGQAPSLVVIAVQVGVFVRCRGILGLKLVELGLVVRAVELAEGAMLVTEHAFFTKITGLLMIESPAILGLEELIIR